MTKRKSTKQLITEAILKEIPSIGLSVEKAIFSWWFTGRQEGLRLTDEGVQAFQLADVAFYDFSFRQEGQSYYSFIANLNKKIKCPYYIGVNKIGNNKSFYIRVYDSKIAMMLNLYGDLNEYLDSIKVTR